MMNWQVIYDKCTCICFYFGSTLICAITLLGYSSGPKRGKKNTRCWKRKHEWPLGESDEDEDVVAKRGQTKLVNWKWFGFLNLDAGDLCRQRREAQRTFSTPWKGPSYHYMENQSLRSQADSTTSSTQASCGSSTAKPRQQSIMCAFSAITPYERVQKYILEF